MSDSTEASFATMTTSETVSKAVDWATLEARGPDRLKWLNGLLTCDLANVGVGEGAYGLSVTKNGKIRSEVMVSVGSESVLLGVRRAAAEALLAELDRHLIMEDAEIAAHPGFEWHLVLGSQAGLARSIAVARGGQAVRHTRRGTEALALAIPISEVGVSEELARALGADCTATPAQWDHARIVAGVPEFGVDFDDTHYPQEASLERDAVSFKKGCYLGQEAVFMLENRGHVKKRLVQLASASPMSVGEPVTTPEGEALGTVTSTTISPEGGLALGWVRYKQSAAGTEVFVGNRPARVTPLLALEVS